MSCPPGRSGPARRSAARSRLGVLIVVSRDHVLLALAYREERILVTEDKDFGELVFVQRLPHPCIVRFVEMRVVEKVAAMRSLIERHADTMGQGVLIVVSRDHVRFRPGP